MFLRSFYHIKISVRLGFGTVFSKKFPTFFSVLHFRCQNMKGKNWAPGGAGVAGGAPVAGGPGGAGVAGGAPG